MVKQWIAARTCKLVENYYSRRMAKKAAAQNGRADLPVSQVAPQRVTITKKENSLALSDVPRPRERERVAQPGEGREGNNKSGRLSSLLDTRVIYCGDNLEQLAKLPNACVDLIYIDRPSTPCVDMSSLRRAGRRRPDDAGNSR
jgi:hypothetical protein